MRAPPDSDQLACFVAVADHGGFSAAARALHRSQPSVHAQVRQLAEDLGVTLYTRVGRGIRLTAEGERVAAYGRAQAAAAAQLRAVLAGSPDEARLATGEGAARTILTEGLRAFCAEGGRLALRISDANGVLSALREGRAELGVTALPALPDDLEGRPLQRVGMAAALPGSHPLTSRKTLGAGDLLDQPLILPPEGRPLRAAVERWLGQDLKVSATATGWDLVLHLVGIGIGIGIVNELIESPPGVVLRPLPALPGPTYWLLWRPGGLPPAARALREALRGSSVRIQPA